MIGRLCSPAARLSESSGSLLSVTDIEFLIYLERGKRLGIGIELLGMLTPVVGSPFATDLGGDGMALTLMEPMFTLLFRRRAPMS